MRILVVDDDPEWQDSIRETFMGRTVDFEFADDAQSGIDRLRQQGGPKIDKLICDGLGGDWTKVHDAVGKDGPQWLLYTSNPDFLDTAREKRFDALDKSASIRELQGWVFPTSGSIEAEQGRR